LAGLTGDGTNGGVHGRRRANRQEGRALLNAERGDFIKKMCLGRVGVRQRKGAKKTAKAFWERKKNGTGGEKTGWKKKETSGAASPMEAHEKKNRNLGR